MVGIDSVVADAEGVQAITLSGEVLLLCRYARVSHQKFVHHPAIRSERPSSRPAQLATSGWWVGRSVPAPLSWGVVPASKTTDDACIRWNAPLGLGGDLPRDV
jgi:hypothetical protein